MPIFYGKSRDGSDMKEFEGFYVNPDDESQWSNRPYDKQNNKEKILFNYMDKKFSLNDVHNQILNKTCKLSAIMRRYVLSLYDNEGNIIKSK